MVIDPRYETLTPKICEEKLNTLNAIANRCDWTKPWITLDENCLVLQHNKLKSSFMSKGDHWIKWHIQVIKSAGNVQPLCDFDLQIRKATPDTPCENNC